MGEGVTYKTLGNGRQPASLTPVSTELWIYGTDETMVIPCITNTKVLEIKEMLGLRLGIDPHSLHFVAKQGCAFRRQLDHEEIRRKVCVTGIDSFTRKKEKYKDPMIVIGAGHVGLRHGLYFLKHNMHNFIIFDRRNKVGGTSWIAQANRTSKLQTELGTYHLQYDEDNPVPKNMPTWPSRDELLQHFDEVSREYGLMPYIRLNTTVKQVECPPSGSLRIHIEKTNGKYEGVLPPMPTGKGIEELNGAAVFMYPGNLSHPRKEPYAGEDTFQGDVVYAMFDNYDYAGVAGKPVVIIGHGAFAVENVRTCCEYGAKRIYMVCRRKNLACPRVASWLANQSEPPVSAALFLRAMEPMYRLTPWDPWSYYSVQCNEARTHVTIQQKARFGIGDVFFLAVYMQRCEVIVDSVKRMTEDTVHLQSGRRIEAAVMLKLLGFTGDFEVDRLLKVKEMAGFWANGDNRRYIASEGPGVSASNFGGTSLSPGAIMWVTQGSHMMDYPKDWETMVTSGMLPLHKAELEIDKPAYVLDARIQTSMGFVIPAFCTLLGEEAAGFGQLKRRKQLECHPLKAFLQEASEEWDEYAKKWKAEDPTLLDPPEYPYKFNTVQAWVAEGDAQASKEIQAKR